VALHGAAVLLVMERGGGRARATDADSSTGAAGAAIMSTQCCLMSLFRADGDTLALCMHSVIVAQTVVLGLWLLHMTLLCVCVTGREGAKMH
jgi:hypothetical protein